LIVTTVGAFGVATGALTGLNDDEGRQTPVADSGFRISPVSLDELRENADIVVEGKLIKRVGQADVVWGQSSPLGENQVIHDIVLPIATYELQVDRYVVGAGPATIELHIGRDLEVLTPDAFVAGESRLWFLVEEHVLKLGGYGLYFGAYGLLAEQKGQVRFGSDSGEPVPFLVGKSLSQVAAEVAQP
jgi:hypothetical protein